MSSQPMRYASATSSGEPDPVFRESRSRPQVLREIPAQCLSRVECVRWVLKASGDQERVVGFAGADQGVHQPQRLGQRYITVAQALDEQKPAPRGAPEVDAPESCPERALSRTVPA